jgi:HlyD family secretion protein
MKNFRLAAVLVGGAAFVFGIVGVWLFFLDSLQVRVVEIREGVVQREVNGPGTVQARIAVNVSSKVTGLIKQVLADQGDTVRQGQLVAALVDDELAAQAAAARAALAAAEHDISGAEALLTKAQADLSVAQSNYERDLQLLRAELISRKAFDESTATLRAAESGVASAESTLAARRAQFRSVHEQLRQAEAQLSYARITSPMDGFVTARKLEVGSTVVPGSPIFQMVDPKTAWVATFIDQTVVGGIRVGQPAVIRLRSGEELRGVVERVTKQADPVTRELEVDVRFQSAPARLTINEEADVTIMVEKAHGLVVPSAALVRQGEAEGVWVVERGRAVFRPLRVGLAGAGKLVAIEGIRAGEQVIVSSKGIKPGQRIRAVAAKGD